MILSYKTNRCGDFQTSFSVHCWPQHFPLAVKKAVYSFPKDKPTPEMKLPQSQLVVMEYNNRYHILLLWTHFHCISNCQSALCEIIDPAESMT